MFDMRMHRILPKWFSISSSKVVPVKRVSNEALLRIVEGPGLLLLKKQCFVCQKCLVGGFKHVFSLLIIDKWLVD